jgi:flagellar basal-body rod modification protein FlgD
MAISNISSVGSPLGTQSTTSEAKQKASLDKDAFLKLLVAQLSQQDPLKPTEGTEFMAQLSQFAMVEQSIAQSEKLDVLSMQMTGMASNEAAGLVGKNVTVRGNGVAFDGVSATSARINLGGPASKVTVRIQDASGKTVRTMEVGPRPAGAAPIVWDGKDETGQLSSKGNYTISVDARTAEGAAVGTSNDVTGRVMKVSFEKGYPELILDSGVAAPVSELVSVGGAVR